jgi:hypothetical protein
VTTNAAKRDCVQQYTCTISGKNRDVLSRTSEFTGNIRQNNMNAMTAMIFLSGAAAAVAAIAFLIPIRSLQWRDGPLPRVAAGLALVVPLLLVNLLATNAPGSKGTEVEALPVALTSSSSGSEGDWSSVAHAFGGPPPTASNASGAPVEQRAEVSVAQMEAATRAAPGNPAHWLALAQTQRLARDYPAAVKAYAEALKLDDSNADAWADYADALGRWQQLRAALPEGSPDAAIIDANIAEARGLSSSAGMPGN